MSAEQLALFAAPVLEFTGDEVRFMTARRELVAQGIFQRAAIERRLGWSAKRTNRVALSAVRRAWAAGYRVRDDEELVELWESTK